ncbi:NAD(P)-dependent oxidoreductase [Tumebacillus sp. BK434]|uniref:NAD(P)-dependent oxidoreductase n=1 Tax=Tumebacillus sp. BK434 TaxID=2512169 RepID=UPI0014052B9A|nr:NAD(P)-dependent oxidoreductase [Tumebacillus sp. BK434]
MNKIGWIGTGVLGSAVVTRLMEAGFDVSVYNRSVEKAEALGAPVAASPKELAAACDVLFLCVKGEAAAEALLFDPETGVVAGGREGLVLVDTSTVSPAFAVSLHDRLLEAGIRYLEAPVSGGREGALKGTMGMVIAGDEAAVEAVRPVLAGFTAKLHYVGAPGKAQLMKVLNNLAESVHMLAAAEVISIGLKAGIELETLHTALSSMRGYSTYMGVLFNRLLEPNDTVSTSLAVRLKDLGLAQAVAEQYDVSIPMGALAQQLFKLSAQQSGLEVDQTECIKLLLN